MKTKSVVEILADANRKHANEEGLICSEFDKLTSEEWEIESREDVERAVLLISEFKNEASVKVDYLKRKIKELEEELDSYKEVKHQKVNALEDKVREFAEIIRRKSPDKKTYYLNYGNLRFTNAPDKWKYPEDEEEFVEACKKAGLEEVVQVKERVHRTNLKEIVYVRDDGKVINPENNKLVEGVSVHEREDYFRVDPK